MKVLQVFAGKGEQGRCVGGEPLVGSGGRRGEEGVGRWDSSKVAFNA